ncbi:hypothetical protein SNEBB_008731 [Seison nebaliae]|nr:hypothetical protein SNEBB_008731 [Seison nebaliae]
MDIQQTDKECMIEKNIRHLKKLVEELKNEKSLDNLKKTNETSLFHLKNYSFVNYLKNMTSFVSSRIGNEPIDTQRIEELIQIRYTLDKCSTIQQKYELHLKNLMKKLEENRRKEIEKEQSTAIDIDDFYIPYDDSETKKNDEEMKKAVYVPPKNVMVKMNENLSKTAKANEESEKNNQILKKKSIMKEIHQYLTDAPEEISHNQQSNKMKKIMEEKTKYEEEHFSRLPTTKFEKKLMNERFTQNDLMDGFITEQKKKTRSKTNKSKKLKRKRR